MLPHFNNKIWKNWLKNSSDIFEITNEDANRFTLFNGFLRLEYVLKNIGGYNQIYLDVLTNPVIRLEGYMDPNKRTPKEVQVYILQILTNDPMDEDKDCSILYETEIENELTIEDFGGHEDFYNHIMKVKQFAKEVRNKRKRFIEPNEIWFENAGYFILETIEKSNLYKVYDSWSKLQLKE